MRVRVLCAVLAVLCLGVLPASAGASTHPFLGVAASGTPIFPLPLPPAPSTRPFDDACGVASGGGLTYVSDYHHQLVAIYGSGGGGYLGKIDSPEAENSPCDLALASTGELYANLLHQGVVRLVPSAATIDPGRSTGVAVDAAGQIYVAHRDRVSVYSPAGALVQTIGLGALTDAYGVAVAPSGRVYVGDAADRTVKAFDPFVNPAAVALTIDGSGTPGGGFTDLSDTDLAVDPSDGDLFVLDNLQPAAARPVAALDEFDAAGAYVGQISHWTIVDSGVVPPKTTNFTFTHAGPSGVTIDAAGNILLTSGDDEGSLVYSFSGAETSTSPLRTATAGAGAGAVTSQLAGVAPELFTGIQCGLLCATEYEDGSVITLKATPEPHSSFTGWSVAGEPGACKGTGTCRVNGLFTPTEVTATFTAIPQRTLTVGKSGSGEGTVTSFPFGLDCGTTCAQSFDQGTKVTLSPEAAAGSEFIGWSGACTGTDPCKVTLAANATANAEFQPIPHVTVTPGADRRPTLAISVGGSGYGSVSSDPAGIECGTPCSGSYAPGTTIVLTATPDPESHFAGWSGCDSSAANRCTVKLGASRTVSANFAEGGLLELGALKLKGTKATLQAKVASAGTLTAQAKQLKPATLKAKRPATLSVPLVLNKAGKRALAKAKSGRLAVKVTLSFKPSGSGAPVVLTRTATFKRSK